MRQANTPMNDQNRGDEQPLSGDGRTVVIRRENVVVRETGAWAPNVHALLRHLDKAGFVGAPRVVEPGFDEAGREVLTYMEGDIINPCPWSDEAIHDLGTLLRQLHAVTASFEIPLGATWRPWFGRTVGTPDIVGHCDAAPWNIVSKAGRPIGLIDWEAAGPVNRLTELAMMAWNNAQLYDDDVAAMNELPDAASRIRQVRIFADAYGLVAADRRQLPDRIIEFAAQSAANEVIEQRITPSTVHAPRVWGIAWQTRSVAWLLRHRQALEAALD
jgi:hypothetical protein